MMRLQRAIKHFALATLTIFALLSIVTSGCGGGGGSSSEGGNGGTTEALEINGPASNPTALLAEQQSTVTISAYVSGSYVELYKLDGNDFIKIGEMTDDGKNGDQAAGDHIYTIQVTVNESENEYVTFRISASTEGEQETRDISIPVVYIPSLTTDTELNQMANDLFLKGLDAQALVTALSTDINNIPSGTMGQIGNDLLGMFSKFEAVTNQDFGFGLFNLAKDAKSINQLLDNFSENPFDSRYSALKQGLIDAGYLSEVDLELDPFELRLYARDYIFNSSVNPNGEGVQFLKSAQKICIKELLSYPISLVGQGLSEL